MVLNVGFSAPHNLITMTKLNKKGHYLDQRLDFLHISGNYRVKEVHLKDLDGKVVPYSAEHFTKSGHDIRINYHDLQGRPFTFNRKRTSSLHASDYFTENFYRLRLSPMKCANGSPKYVQPKNTRVLPYLNGLLQFYHNDLHTIRTIYLTEGEFKAFVGCMHDIPTIGAGGIHSFSINTKDEYNRTVKNEFLPEIVEALDQMPNLERIVLLHDADAREGDDERRHNFFLSVKYFNYCVKEYNSHIQKTKKRFIASEYWVAKNKEHKGLDDLLIACPYAEDDFKSDLSDYHIKHTLYIPGEHGRESIKRLEFLRQWFSLTNKPFRVDFVGANLHVQKLVSERKAELIELVEKHPRILIQAPTGSGKTFTFLKEIIPARLTANPDERVAFVVPTKALAEEISASYNIPLVHGGIEGEERMMAFESRLYVTTLDSAPLMGVADTLVVDEAHTLTRDFRQKAKQGLEDLMNLSERTILLTATPSALWSEFGYHLVNISQENPKKRDVHVHLLDKKHSLNNVVSDLIYQCSKEDKGSVSFIRMNNKTTLKNAMEEAIKMGLYGKNEIAYIDSSEESKGYVYASITNSSRTPFGVRLVLMTSLMDEGVNINNTNIGSVHFLQDKISGDLRDEQAIQFISRFRKWEGKANLYVKNDDREIGNSWHPRKYFEQQLNAANDELKAMQLRGSDQTKGENQIRTHSERSLLQWSEMRGCWMVSQNGLITDTLLFFARRLPVAEYIKQLKAFDGFTVSSSEYEHSKGALGFRQECKSSGIIKRETRKHLRQLFDQIFTHDPEGVIASFYRYHARPFDKKTIREVWPHVELWEPAYSIELKQINEVHTVYSYIYDVAKLVKCGVGIADAVDLYLNWYNTKTFKLMFATFEFWGVMKDYKAGKRISSRDRQLAERIDSVRMFVLEMHHKGQTISLRDIKQRLYKRGVRVRLDDLKLWIDMVADVREVAHKGNRKIKVLEIYGLDQYLSRFQGGAKVGYFFNDSPNNLHPKKRSQRIEKQTFASKSEKPICSLTRVQIAIQKGAISDALKMLETPSETDPSKNPDLLE